MDGIAQAQGLLEGRVAVLTGAGVSTDSGIPDYRGPETARRARNPVRFAQFVGDAGWRQRYWARATVGWRRVADATPNHGHRALAEMAPRLVGLITQNVDGLHQAAGSLDVNELHGSLHRVVCLACGTREPRAELQERLELANPGFATRAVEVAPDGDAELDDVASFRVVDCLCCGGPLKPDVVFFGESVPRDRVERGYAAVEAADALLVAGSSLTVFSGYRFVKRAHALGRPVVIATLGPTRGDALAAVKLDAPLGEVLPALSRPRR
jgi:NAD-dependent SIR2 family protein deacetylase